jgi:hypothetical protein
MVAVHICAEGQSRRSPFGVVCNEALPSYPQFLAGIYLPFPQERFLPKASRNDQEN